VDEGADAFGSRTEAGGGLKVAFESGQGGVEAVADGGLDQAAEALDRVEFRALGRQPQQPDVWGIRGSPSGRWKPAWSAMTT
jgi:hypothetical protein